MIILPDLSAEVPDTNAFHFKLEELSTDGDLLFYGYNSYKSAGALKGDSRASYFNNWMPCEFAQGTDRNGNNALNYDSVFDSVYAICPYTVKWLNNINGNERYRYGFYPYNKSIVPKEQEKKFDVIYHGGIHGKEHEECLQVMSKFNYRYVTMRRSINQRTIDHLKYGTNFDLPFQEKINLVGQCKISVCFNFVHNEQRHIKNIKSYPRWEENEAFSETDKWNIMPQFKTRFHEAAISKTLNLCMKDPWNVVEDYYEPEREFLYFETMEELEEMIDDIRYNFEDYEDVVDAAYERVKNYTTDNFVNLVESGKSWEGRDA